MVYSCVDLYPVGINELINKTGLSLQTVSGALVELELEGKNFLIVFTFAGDSTITRYFAININSFNICYHNA